MVASKEALECHPLGGAQTQCHPLGGANHIRLVKCTWLPVWFEALVFLPMLQKVSKLLINYVNVLKFCILHNLS